MLASSVLLLALATAGQAEKKWEVVTSQEGKFTVEMPAKPSNTSSSTSKGPNGKVTINEISCETAEGGFIVVRIDAPLTIPKEAEESYLDFTRDYYAAKFHGKVTVDKKVKLGLTNGRDFTIKAQTPDVGVTNIRAREYVQGKVVYLLLAASEPNKPLPAEAARFLGSFAFGIHPEGTTIQADKRETEAVGEELAGWGMAIDPDGDVKFTPSEKSLEIQVPGTLHDLDADKGKFNAPRVLQPIDGDFSMIVKVDGDFKPGGKSTKEKVFPLTTAGLLLWKDSDNYAVLLRVAVNKNGKIGGIVAFQEREAGHRGGAHDKGMPTGPFFMRLERKKNRITGAVSEDGVTWTPLKAIDTTWADGPVRVGLVATTFSSEPFTARFENFKVKAAK